MILGKVLLQSPRGGALSYERGTPVLLTEADFIVVTAPQFESGQTFQNKLNSNKRSDKTRHTISRLQEKIIFIELMTSDRKLKASVECSK